MRSVVLDSLRGIAILLVLFRHYHFSFLMNKIGWIGVDLFFVLSGFLVSGLLFKEYQKTELVKPIPFLIRRGFKIYPTFYFFLILTYVGYIALKAVGHEHPLEVQKLLYEALFVQNYVKAIWGHTWSLAVEEHFYLLLALVIFLLVRSNKLADQRFVIISISITLLIVFLLRVITWQVFPTFSFHTHMYATHLRLDSLLFGVFVSYFFHFNSTLFYRLANAYWKPTLLAAIIILALPFFLGIDSPWMGTIGLSMLYLAFGSILWIAVAFEPVILSVRGLTYLFRSVSFVGLYSYSIYVFHTMMAAFVMPFVEKILSGVLDSRILFLIYAAICVMVGVVFSKLIEFPFIAMRDRYFPKAIHS
jgi:peptidoglycan/LPS O-acetylase OafA/YrhL